jgi:hypothetical protein
VDQYLVQNAYGRFLPALRHNGESYLSLLYINNSIGQVALSKDRLLLRKAAIFLPPLMVERNLLVSNLGRFLAAAAGLVTSQAFRICESNVLRSRMINALEGREQYQVCRQNRDPPDEHNVS